MDPGYEFVTPKRFRHVIITVGVVPTLLRNALSGSMFHPGALWTRIQNVGGDLAYWSWGSASPGSSSGMSRIPIDGMIQLNWETKDLNLIWVAGESITSAIVVVQEGK